MFFLHLLFFFIFFITIIIITWRSEWEKSHCIRDDGDVYVALNMTLVDDKEQINKRRAKHYQKFCNIPHIWTNISFMHYEKYKNFAIFLGFSVWWNLLWIFFINLLNHTNEYQILDEFKKITFRKCFSLQTSPRFVNIIRMISIFSVFFNFSFMSKFNWNCKINKHVIKHIFQLCMVLIGIFLFRARTIQWNLCLKKKVPGAYNK